MKDSRLVLISITRALPRRASVRAYRVAGPAGLTGTISSQREEPGGGGGRPGSRREPITMYSTVAGLKFRSSGSWTSSADADNRVIPRETCTSGCHDLSVLYRLSHLNVPLPPSQTRSACQGHSRAWVTRGKYEGINVRGVSRCGELCDDRRVRAVLSSLEIVSPVSHRFYPLRFVFQKHTFLSRWTSWGWAGTLMNRRFVKTHNSIRFTLLRIELFRFKAVVLEIKISLRVCNGRMLL